MIKSTIKETQYYIGNLIRFILISFVSLIILASCEISAFKDDITEKDYSFDTLMMLNVKNDINVIFIQDSFDFIKIKAPEGLHEKIFPEIKYDTIILKNNNRSKIINRYNQNVTAELHYTDFRIFFFQGGGNVSSSDTMKMKNLSIWSNGASGIINLTVKNDYMHFGLSTGNIEIEIHGETESLSLWTTSYCFVDMLDLKTKSVNIRNNSPMDCYINVLEKLTAKTEYTGNIYYKGNPSEKVIAETGSGKVLKTN